MDYPSEGTWSVFAERVVEERDQLRDCLSEIDKLCAREEIRERDAEAEGLPVIGVIQVRTIREILRRHSRAGL